MNIAAIIHRYHRLRELGWRKSAQSIEHKLKRSLFCAQWRTKALQKKALHSWQTIAHAHNAPESFNVYWHQHLQKSLPMQHISYIQDQADAYVMHQFDVLGSGPAHCPTLPWHEDIRLRAQDPQADYTFDSSSFYQDIRITLSPLPIAKDIKVPWELCRFHHGPILGQAYQTTGNQIYAQTFTHHITSWLENNPYLIGINWLCPMEVSIRAINWIWTWDYFKSSPHISTDFWQRFTQSLYDHMHYLEHNWEIFDTKTSNHYLSDLLGYLYLCWFFDDLSGIQAKRNRCVQELIKECEKQIFAEGTDYESSTAYHQLVTEILDHVIMLCNHMHIELPQSLHEKHARMHDFLAWCQVNDEYMVKIGDDDSGHITKIRPRDPSTQLREDGNEISQCVPPARHSLGDGWECRSVRIDVSRDQKDICRAYPQFGLSIIKKDNWHITFRHYAYKEQQPSAHFHNDALSITLAMNGIPVIIDPGSYLYTASPHWRNYFRSTAVHNTMFVRDHESTPFDERLFALALKAHSKTPEIQEHHNSITIEDSHTLYARMGLTAKRSMLWQPDSLLITDRWHGDAPVTYGWNFTLHPAITAQACDTGWVLLHQNKPLLFLQSSLDFQVHDAWVAPRYGVKEKSTCLRAYSSEMDNESKIVLIKL